MRNYLAIYCGAFLCYSGHSQTALVDQVRVTPSVYLQAQKQEPRANDFVVTNRFDAEDEVFLLLTNMAGNGTTIIYPRKTLPYEFHLFDAAGHNLQAAGPPSYGGNLASPRLAYISPQYRYFLSMGLVPDRFFTIPNKGVYTLTARMHFLVLGTNGKYSVATTDPIRVEVEKR